MIFNNLILSLRMLKNLFFFNIVYNKTLIKKKRERVPGKINIFVVEYFFNVSFFLRIQLEPVTSVSDTHLVKPHLFFSPVQNSLEVFTTKVSRAEEMIGIKQKSCQTMHTSFSCFIKCLNHSFLV